MRRTNRLISASLLLIYAAGGCHKVVTVPQRKIEPGSADEIVGVVLVSGTKVDFQPGRGRLTRDTVYAPVGRGFPLDSVTHLLIRKGDPAQAFFGTIAIAALATLGAVLVVAATKESCPFVYSWDGSRWIFDAEPYGGAVARGLARDDYGALEHLRPAGGEYRLLVTNEVNESQMTDLARLLVIDHSPAWRPIPDEFGRFHSIAAPVVPTRAADPRGADLLPWLAQPDGIAWEPRPSPDPGTTRDTITLAFAKPAGATTMKFVARVATGIWGSHQIRSQLSLYGGTVDDWYRRIDSNPLAADSVRQWSVREGLYGLPIEVREPDGWRLRGIMLGGGPFIAEDRVIPLDVSRVVGDVVELRLRPARSFWGFDWFAADFSAPQDVRVDTLSLVSATDQVLGDVRGLLASADGRYHPMPATGDRATLTFTAPPERPGIERSVFIHTRGWYRLRGLPTGPADRTLVDNLMNVPEFAARLAAEEYRRRLAARN